MLLFWRSSEDHFYLVGKTLREDPENGNSVVSHCHLEDGDFNV
jgi:hypothetical protein